MNREGVLRDLMMRNMLANNGPIEEPTYDHQIFAKDLIRGLVENGQPPPPDWGPGPSYEANIEHKDFMRGLTEQPPPPDWGPSSRPPSYAENIEHKDFMRGLTEQPPSPEQLSEARRHWEQSHPPDWNALLNALATGGKREK